MVELKVSKNVTFTLVNVQLIRDIMLKHHIKTFSGAINSMIDTLIRVQHASRVIEIDLQEMTIDRDKWRDRYEQTKQDTGKPTA